MQGTKKIKRFLKQYFVFSKAERKGIYALLALIAVIVFAPDVINMVFPPELVKPEVHTLPLITVDSAVAEVHVKENAATYRRFMFDPNTADSISLISLGFGSKAVRGMMNYRRKGGYFRKPDDLFRIYHTDSALIRELLPFVRIAITEKVREKREFPKTTFRKTEPVEINSADSATLVTLYGIGPKMASRIISYRARIGGFWSVGQLTEVYGLSHELIEELGARIYVDDSKVKKLFINSVTLEELKRHPYLRYKIAGAIVAYRNQHGPFTRPEDLKKVLVIPDSIYRKLLPYLHLDAP